MNVMKIYTCVSMFVKIRSVLINVLALTDMRYKATISPVKV